jgi:hypothetical protein
MPSPAVAVSAPGRSSGRGEGAIGRTAYGVSPSTTSATGTLTNMTQRQEARSVSTPPRISPTEAPSPDIAE